MPSYIDQLAQSLFQTDRLEYCSLEELQQAADRYPYFSAAHLLLCKKLQKENSSQFMSQLQRTSVFFPNTAWLEYLLHDTGGAEHIPSPVEESVKVDMPEAPIVQESSAQIMEEKKTEQENLPDKNESEDPVPIAALKMEPFDPSKESFTFAPLYTVDYFASQGIKFKEEEKPKDKFGQQLKSFTEWLKTLKTTPVSEIAKKVEPIAEQKIEMMAGESIQDRDVITEAMAEVWEKQGNYSKAVDIYNKLSLLEPAKRRYFAAKIEALKKTN